MQFKVQIDKLQKEARYTHYGKHANMKVFLHNVIQKQMHLLINFFLNIGDTDQNKRNNMHESAKSYIRYSLESDPDKTAKQVRNWRSKKHICRI
jgi:hypothetical protein